MRLSTHAGLVAALAGLLWSNGASAASFDCATAKKPMERAICESPAVSKLDEEMAHSYQRALRALSSGGASALKTSQRSWLRYADQRCIGNQRRESSRDACLERLFRERVGELGQAGLKLGALVLNRIDGYEAFPNPSNDDSGGNDGLVVHRAGYPQIEGAITKAVAAWNERQAQHSLRSLILTREWNETDLHQDYVIACASAKVLSIRVTFSEYGHGAAHGLYSNDADTFWLEPDIHPLKAEDLFSQESGWETKLPALFIQAYLADERHGPRSLNDSVESTIRGAAVQYARWLLTPAGLQINFSAYEAGSYMNTPGPITVAWSALKPMLIHRSAPTCAFSFIDSR
ncbi:lysozyme inhibitor LprI family protein [Roseateles sp. NT4]|uniref:lysozyme inhibitor LprI family protein n=1 Tax=Roseateles sp. NT4 TaxID=3453715 RepID=UPI003EEB9278